MSLATRLQRWIAVFGVVLYVAIVGVVDHYQNLDRQRAYQIEANHILSLVQHFRSTQSIGATNPNEKSPWCNTSNYSNTSSQSKFLIKNKSLKPINPLNHPSARERSILSILSEQGVSQSQGEIITQDDIPWYTVARPIHFSAGCLSCHGPATTHADAGQDTPSPNGRSVEAATFVYIDVLQHPSNSLTSPPHIVLAIMIALASLALWILAGKWILKPLSITSQTLERFAAAPNREGLAQSRLPEELQRLHRAFAQIGQNLLHSQASLNAGLQELAEEENRFRALTQSAVDAIVSADENGHVSSWNRGAERIFGYSEQEMMGKPITLLIPPKFLPSHLSGFASAIASGSTRHQGETQEVQGIRKDGLHVALEVALSTWSLSGRRYFTAIIRDISKRKKNAEKNHRDFMSRMAINSILEVALKSIPLQEQLTKSLQIILAVPWLSLQYKGAIFLYNSKSGNLEISVNQGLGEQIVLSCKEVALGSCLCGQAAATKKIVFSSTVDDQHTVRFDGIQPHGHYCVPILLEERLLGVLNLYLQVGHVREVEDIRFLETVAQTLAGLIERKMSERKLRYLYQAMEQSPVSVVITDLQGHIEYVNPCCCRVSGYEAHELLGQKPSVLKSGEIPTPVYKGLWDTILSGKVWRGELRNRRKNGEPYWEDISISPIRYDNGKVRYFLAVKEDVTQRKQLETDLAELLSTLDIRVMERTRELKDKIAELEHTRNELVKSEKMASLGRLVAGFAHEINTPIGVAVTGFSLIGDTLNTMEALLMQEEVREDEFRQIISTAREAAELALANISRAGELVASFKRTSVDQSSDDQRIFNVREIFTDVIRSLHNKIKKTGITFHVHVDPALNVLGWPGLLDQIVTNFIINSLTHGYPSDDPKGQITLAARIENNTMVLDYTDDGCGMEESVRSLVFEPFFTTRRAQGGSGLGLYLCYNIVTSRLHGVISCESSPGQGVRYHITFPIGGTN
ncbi:MAG: PAS domain S-box protein [Magnetococcales bacterium]|nr:PAS domain S-box protein [Magnetococcales bacterium]